MLKYNLLTNVSALTNLSQSPATISHNVLLVKTLGKGRTMKNKSSIVCVLAVCMVFAFCGEVSANIWYVDAAKPIGQDGTSWAKAFKYIDSAIHAASSSWTECFAPNDQIWVKQGTYTLTGVLVLNKTVIMYGGFPSAIDSPTLILQRHLGFQHATPYSG
jgi:hypothetical protein